MESLRKKTASAALWSFAGNTGATVIRFGIGVVIARILSPEDYGLVAMFAIFLGVGTALVDSGFSQALIQKVKPSQLDYSSVFFLNIVIAIVIYLALWLTSPFIASFYNEPSIKQLVVFLSFTLVLNSLTAVQHTHFVKELKFKEISKLRVVSTIVSGVIAIPMAIKGYGVWSLVGLNLSQAGSFSLLLWRQSSWRPSFMFSIESIKSLFGFGSRILGIGLLDNIFLHLNKLIIGKYFYSTELGLYTRAYNYRDLVSKRMLGIINAVAFPAFSKIQDDNTRLKDNLRSTSELAIFLISPSLALLAFAAEPLIRFLITNKWIECVPYLQILCIAGLFYPVSGLQVGILKAIGRANVYFRIILIHKIAIVLSILIAIKWGVLGLVYAQVFTMFLIYFLGVLCMKKYLNISVFDQFKSFFPYPIVGVIVFYGSYLISNMITSNDLLLILFQTIVGMSVYLLWGWLSKTEGWYQTIRLLKEQVLPKLKKRSK